MSKQPNIHLSDVMTHLRQRVALIEHRIAQPVLLRARLADFCRDAQVTPMPLAGWDRAVRWLDSDEDWRRLALFISLFELEDVAAAIKWWDECPGLGVMLQDGLAWIAVDHPLLTIDLLRQSDMRLEEFSRHAMAALRIELEGETLLKSAQQRRRLDYSRLTTESKLTDRTLDQQRDERIQRQIEDRRNADVGFDRLPK